MKYKTTEQCHAAEDGPMKGMRKGGGAKGIAMKTREQPSPRMEGSGKKTQKGPRYNGPKYTD